MNLKKQKLVIALALITVLTATVSTIFGQNIQLRQSSDSSNIQGERSITGVWRTVVTPRICQTGMPIPGVSTIPGLFTFNQGGTMSEYGISTAQGQTPALRSPGHGTWQREEGFSSYTFKFIFYRYNASGVFLGTQKVTATLVLSSDFFSVDSIINTTSTVEIFDANDNLIGTGCATAVGRRFE